MTVATVQIAQAESPAQIEQARELFLEYAQSLGFSLCFQNFDKELAGLPGDYVPPDGRLLLAESDGKLAGCVALHKFKAAVCEMKRLYVRPGFRGQSIGRNLADRIIAEAREIGYTHMRLDTVGGTMDRAIAMYRQMGFQEIAPYRENPMPGVLYMELDLQSSFRNIQMKHSGSLRFGCVMFAALLAWFGLGLQLYVILVGAHAKGISTIAEVVRFFSFFTILTNILVALTLTASLPQTATNDRHFFRRATVQSAVAVYIAFVGLAYSLLLRHLWDPEGLQRIADLILHDIIPVLYIVYWLSFVQKGRLRPKDIVGWLAYPIAYLFYSLVRGALTGLYAYPFVDVGALGYPRALINATLLLVAFVVLSLLLIALDRRMKSSLVSVASPSGGIL